MIRIFMLLLSLTILVTLHELGHYLPARWFGTKVKKFYIFFDFLFPVSTLLPYSLFRVVWDSPSNRLEFFKNKAAITLYRTGHSKTDTEWGIGYFPLGGYVQIAGMVDETQDESDLEAEPQPWEFRSKKAWQRLIIMIGGVTVNFVLGILIFAMMFWSFGKEYLPTANAIYGIQADSIAQSTGFRNGDKILTVGGKPFDKFNPRTIVRDIVINNATVVDVERNGERATVNVSPDVQAVLATQAAKDIEFIAPRRPIVIGEVEKGKSAESAGLQKDDKIIGLNGKKIDFYDEFRSELKGKKNQAVEVSILRNEKDTIKANMKTDENARIGISVANLDKFFKLERQNYNLLESFPAGLDFGLSFIGDQVKAFGQMFKGKIKASESMGGIGSMAKMFPETWDWESFWRMTGILSFVLAVMNLLPIPGLDGGYVVFLLWEMITGKKPNEKVVEKLTTIGFFILIGLMLYANGLDVIRAWIK